VIEHGTETVLIGVLKIAEAEELLGQTRYQQTTWQGKALKQADLGAESGNRDTKTEDS
jgi:hypothetical protein